MRKAFTGSAQCGIEGMLAKKKKRRLLLPKIYVTVASKESLTLKVHNIMMQKQGTLAQWHCLKPLKNVKTLGDIRR